MAVHRGIIRFGWVTQTGDHRTTRRRCLRPTQRRRGTIIAMITMHLIAPTRITVRIIRDLIDRKRTLGPIIRGRGVPLLSTLRRTARRRHIQPRPRTRLPNTQSHSTMHMKARALSHLTMSTMRSRLTKQQASQYNIVTWGHPQ